MADDAAELIVGGGEATAADGRGSVEGEGADQPELPDVAQMSAPPVDDQVELPKRPAGGALCGDDADDA